MVNEKELEREEREKYRSADIARIFFSILVLVISRNIAVVNIFMSFHLVISVSWMALSEKYPLFQSRRPLFWLVPASLDVLNCLMIIYVTGSAYSSWILSLTFITAISASDPLLWRGAFTGIAGAFGLTLMLILVQTGVLPFSDIWKINYRPHSWSLVVQAAALNAGVSFFVWSAVHGASVIANTGRSAAEKESSLIHLIFKKIFSAETVEKIHKGTYIESEFSPVMTVALDQESRTGDMDEKAAADIFGFINSAIIEYDMKFIFYESDFFAVCRINTEKNPDDLNDVLQAARKIYSYVSDINRSKKGKKHPTFKVRVGISLENISAVKSNESDETYIPVQKNIISSLKIAYFGKKEGIYVSENVQKHLSSFSDSKLEGTLLLKGRAEKIYSLKNQKPGTPGRA